MSTVRNKIKLEALQAELENRKFAYAGMLSKVRGEHREAMAELEALKEENKVLKLTVEHYKSDKYVKF